MVEDRGLLIGAMFVLDHPEGVNDLTLLVVRYLLEVQVSRIVCFQACVAIVLQKKSIKLFCIQIKTTFRFD